MLTFHAEEYESEWIASEEPEQSNPAALTAVPGQLESIPESSTQNSNYTHDPVAPLTRDFGNVAVSSEQTEPDTNLPDPQAVQASIITKEPKEKKETFDKSKASWNIMSFLTDNRV